MADQLVARPEAPDVLFDQKSLIAGQDWDRTLKDAQREADMALLVFSHETSSKTGVIQREIKEILRRLEDHPFGDIYLIILRTDDLSLPQELSRYHYID